MECLYDTCEERKTIESDTSFTPSEANTSKKSSQSVEDSKTLQNLHAAVMEYRNVKKAKKRRRFDVKPYTIPCCRTSHTQTEYFFYMYTRGTNTNISQGVPGPSVGIQTNISPVQANIQTMTDFDMQSSYCSKCSHCTSIKNRIGSSQSNIHSSLNAVPSQFTTTENYPNSEHIQTAGNLDLLKTCRCVAVQTDPVQSIFVSKISHKVSTGTQNPEFGVCLKQTINNSKNQVMLDNNYMQQTENILPVLSRINEGTYLHRETLKLTSDLNDGVKNSNLLCKTLLKSGYLSLKDKKVEVLMLEEGENKTADGVTCQLQDKDLNEGEMSVTTPMSVQTIPFIGTIKSENLNDGFDVNQQNVDQTPQHKIADDTGSEIRTNIGSESRTDTDLLPVISIKEEEVGNSSTTSDVYDAQQQSLLMLGTQCVPVEEVKKQTEDYYKLKDFLLENGDTGNCRYVTMEVEKLTEDYCNLKDFLLENRDNWKFLELYKSKGIQMINADKIRFMRMYESDNPGIELSVTIENNFEAKICVHGRQLAMYHDLWIGQPIVFNRVDVIFELLRKISEYVTCIGNPEPDYINYLLYNSSRSLVSLPIIDAFTEQDHGAIVQNLRYKSTTRSFRCSLLIRRSSSDLRCSACTQIREQINCFKN